MVYSDSKGVLSVSIIITHSMVVSDIIKTKSVEQVWEIDVDTN